MRNINNRDIKVGAKVILNLVLWRKAKSAIAYVTHNTDTEIHFIDLEGVELCFPKEYIVEYKPEHTIIFTEYD